MGKIKGIKGLYVDECVCRPCKKGEHGECCNPFCRCNAMKDSLKIRQFPDELVDVDPIKLPDDEKIELYKQSTFITIKTPDGKISGRGKSNMFIVNHWKFSNIVNRIIKSKKGYVVLLQ